MVQDHETLTLNMTDFYCSDGSKRSVTFQHNNSVAQSSKLLSLPMDVLRSASLVNVRRCRSFSVGLAVSYFRHSHKHYVSLSFQYLRFESRYFM